MKPLKKNKKILLILKLKQILKKVLILLKDTSVMVAMYNYNLQIKKNMAT